MILTARYVRRPRKPWRCDWCEKPLAAHIYLYGAADTTDTPSGARLHVGCCATDRGDPKMAAALAAAESETR